MKENPPKKKKVELPIIKVLLVDDHDVVREGVKLMLSRDKDISIIGEANSGLNALQLVRECQPDVVLLDIKMPGDIGGLGTTIKLSHSHPGIKILVLSTCEDDPFPTQLMKAGAVGYLHKRCSAAELAQAIRQVYSGKQYITPSIAQQLVPDKKRKKKKQGAAAFLELSEREMTVAIMISNGQSIKEVASKLCISNKTVNTYRYRIFKKMGIKNDIELTHLAIKHNVTDKHAPESIGEN